MRFPGEEGAARARQGPWRGRAMGNGGATSKVVVDHDFQFVERGMRRRKTLDQDAVHSVSVKLLQQQPHVPGNGYCLSCTTRLDGLLGVDPRAERVVQAARHMARRVAAEERDVLHAEWGGPDGREPLEVLLEEQDSSLQGYMRQQRLGDAIKGLAHAAQRLVASQPTLAEATVPAKVFGDIHGQFRDMLLLLHDFGFPNETTSCSYIFNGDWVDRGKHQLEVVCLIFALKLAFPALVRLVRGNHEDAVQSDHMGEKGFRHQCVIRLGKKLGQEVFKAANEVFEWLPLGCVLDGSILVVHGGIGNGDWDLNYLRRVERPLNHDALAEDPVLYNVLWSDPIPEDKLDSCGVHDSPRDNHAHLIHTFGSDVTEAFCKRNGLALVVRSHECMRKGTGYEVMHDNRCVRVFSARDYEGHGNHGSILSIVRGPDSFVVQPQVVLSVHQRGNAPGLGRPVPEDE